MDPTSLEWTKKHQQMSEPVFYGKWVDVKQKRPKFGQDESVLCYFKDGMIVVVHVDDFDCNVACEYNPITHWMRLPGKPKNDTK